MNTFYLNNSGHRWITTNEKGKKEKVKIFFPETGKMKMYTPLYIEAVGNFAHIVTRIKGKRECLIHYRGDLYLVNNEANRCFKYQQN
jgi:hypothetical protein